MRDSAYRWRIVKNAKIFQFSNMCKIVESCLAYSRKFS